MSKELQPAVSTELLYPEDAVYMARTDLIQTRMLGYKTLNLDTVTSFFVGLLNGRCAIRHEAGAGREVFEIFERAGIRVEEETWTYRSGEEAEDLADKMVAQGKRLFSPYPLRAGRLADSGQIVPPALHRALNAKARLDTLVPPVYLPQRRILTHEELASFEPTEPVFLKAGGDAATGWGYAVRPCPDKAAFDKARYWFIEHREDVPVVLLEEWIDISTCWCAGAAVLADKTICFGGAEQVFASTARQSGSMMDPEKGFPAEGHALVVTIGEAARRSGYRGLAGFDIGLSRDGRLFVFDLNFRINSSSTQLLFHASSVARTGLPATCSFQSSVGGSFAALAERLAAPLSDGSFVPVRMFNGEKHPLSKGTHIVTGFVHGRDRLNAINAAKDLHERLEG